MIIVIWDIKIIGCGGAGNNTIDRLMKIGIQGAKEGERRKIYIHPDFGFGRIGRACEPNQTLIYEVHIFKNHLQDEKEK